MAAGDTSTLMTFAGTSVCDFGKFSIVRVAVVSVPKSGKG